MSWDQKSMFHSCKKRHQAHDNSESHKRLRTSAVVDEEAPCCSYSLFEGKPQSPPPTERSSTSQGSCRTSSTTITSSTDVDTRSDKGDESQDEEYLSSSDVSSENLCSDVLLMKVDLLEHFLLYKYKMKQPILKEDMLKLIGEHNQDEFADILKKASELIEAVSAVDLKEVDSSSHSYDLVSKLKLPNNGRVHAGRGFPKTGLLMNILGLIFMKGNRVTEEELWEFLNEMEVYAGKKHFIYGEPRKLITEDFVQLQYLEYYQVPNSNPPRYGFLWGPKAHAETSNIKVLEFLAKVKGLAPRAVSPWCEEALQNGEG